MHFNRVNFKSQLFTPKSIRSRKKFLIFEDSKNFYKGKSYSFGGSIDNVKSSSIIKAFQRLEAYLRFMEESMLKSEIEIIRGCPKKRFVWSSMRLFSINSLQTKHNNKDYILFSNRYLLEKRNYLVQSYRNSRRLWNWLGNSN